VFHWVLIFISLILSNVEHLFMCLLTSMNLFLDRCPFLVFTYLFIFCCHNWITWIPVELPPTYSFVETFLLILDIGPLLFYVINISPSLLSFWYIIYSVIDLKGHIYIYMCVCVYLESIIVCGGSGDPILGLIHARQVHYHLTTSCLRYNNYLLITDSASLLPLKYIELEKIFFSAHDI
jgi:hypothetical protein